MSSIILERELSPTLERNHRLFSTLPSYAPPSPVGTERQHQSRGSIPEAILLPEHRSRRTQEEVAPLPTALQIEQEAQSPFGPQSIPLFYTALQSPPQRLLWEDSMQLAAKYGTINVTVWDDQDAFVQVNSVHSGNYHLWPLAELDFEPGLFYHWRLGTESLADFAMQNRQKSSPVELPVFASQAGCFWLLSTEEEDRLAKGLETVSQIAEPEYKAMAEALLMTELGLFHDAIQLVKNGPACCEQPTRTLLAHTLQALVYRKMGKHLESQGKSQPSLGSLLPSALLWTRNREQYHRQRITALMQSSQTKEMQSPMIQTARLFDQPESATSHRRRAA